jgi:hypothetical protein
MLALLTVCTGGSARVFNVSVCDLVKQPSFYDHKIVIVKADVRGSGLHASRLKDRNCLSASEISLSEDAIHHAGHLRDLMTAIQSAFHDSTSEKRRYVEAVFVGTFFAHSAETSGAELRLKDVNSIRIVEGNDLIPRIPPSPPR